MPRTPNGTSNKKSKSSSSSSWTKRVAILAALVAVGFAGAKKVNLKRVKNTIRGMYLLGTMPESDWDAYYKSLDVLAKPMLQTKEDELAVGSWYKVINLLCDLGELEKMYFPPLVDPELGIVDNQILIENKMALAAASYEWDPMYINKVGDQLPENLKKRYVVNNETGEKKILPVDAPVPARHSVRPMDVLDLGCGKGRIANEMMLYTDGNVKGLNIDVTQVQNAMRFALEHDLWPEKLDFRHGSFNDPLPFPDESFDYVYEVAAFTYVIDKMAVFKEIYRVLSPGGAFVYQDWTDTGYNPDNKTQAEMILKVKLVSGLIELHDPREVADVAQKAGFEILFNDDGGYEAKPSSKLCTVKSFKFVRTFMDPLIKYKILPPRLVKAWQTMHNLGIHQLRYSIEEGILNMGHVLLVRKPMN